MIFLYDKIIKFVSKQKAELIIIFNHKIYI